MLPWTPCSTQPINPTKRTSFPPLTSIPRRCPPIPPRRVHVPCLSPPVQFGPFFCGSTSSQAGQTAFRLEPLSMTQQSRPPPPLPTRRHARSIKRWQTIVVLLFQDSVNFFGVQLLRASSTPSVDRRACYFLRLALSLSLVHSWNVAWRSHQSCGSFPSWAWISRGFSRTTRP